MKVKNTQPLLFILGGVVAACLILASVLPEEFWKTFFLQATRWTTEDASDLRYFRVLILGWGLVVAGWTVFAGKDGISLHKLSPKQKQLVFDILFFVLVAATALMIARIFIVFHDHVRIVGAKTPYSNWGEFLGKTLTVPFEQSTDRDFFNALFLAGAGLSALFMAFLRSRDFPQAHALQFPIILWGFLAAGFIWASVDELLMIHEVLGPNLPILRETTFTKYPDDVIILVYALVGFIVFVRYFRFLSANKLGFAFFLIGVAFQGIASTSGLKGIFVQEESFEMYSGLCYFASMITYSFTEVRDSIEAMKSSRGR